MAAASTEPLPAGEVAADGAAEAAVSDLRLLPDQALQGMLQRMQRSVDGGIAARLRDGGRIYRLRLLAIRGELARRQAAAAFLAPPPPSTSTEPMLTRQGEKPADTPACPSKQLPDVDIIKPKLEPCQDSPVPAPEAADDDSETTPLSGDHPFFTIILSRSHVQKKFQLCIPGRFHKRLPDVCTPATLICRGKSWAMSYCGDLKVKKLDADWMGFAVDNRLQVNDACVFELVTSTKEEVVFHMQILRGGLPEEVTSKGASADKPMIIED